MKMIIFLLSFLSFIARSQDLTNIDKKIDSLQKVRNKHILSEVPLLIFKTQRVIDSLSKESEKYSQIINKINLQKVQKEGELAKLNYQILRASGENMKINITYRIAFYPKPDVMVDVDWISGNSELFLLAYDGKSSFVKFLKVSCNGKMGYVMLSTLLEDSAVSATVNSFLRSKDIKVSESSINTGNSSNSSSQSSSNSYESSHYYQTGPRGGHYYINSNGNKTYKKKN